MHLAAQRTNTLNRKRACTECARARERCSRDEPCLRCSSKSLQCLYPDDAGQKMHSFTNDSLMSDGNELGQPEEQPPKIPVLPKPANFMASNPINRAFFNDEDIPFREFLHSLRSQTTSSYIPNSSLNSLHYKSSVLDQERQPHSNIALDHGIGSEPRSFVEPTLDTTGRQVPLFDQPPASSFHRPQNHDMINLDNPRFGQALGEYPSLCPTAMATDPPLDYHSEPAAQPDRFLPVSADKQHGAGVLGSLGRESEGLVSSAADGVASTASSAGTPRRPLSLSDFSSQPINLKAYELLASNFKEACVEYGNEGSSASSNNISESQRTAQHELLVKLYYEHFKQQVY